jgi:hypothetical protein
MTERVGLEVDTLTIRIPMRLQRRGGRKLIMTPEGIAAPARKPSRDETLIRALVRAHRWRRKIECGQAKSITDLAEQEGVTDAYVCRLLPLTCLAPDIVEAVPVAIGCNQPVPNGGSHAASPELKRSLLKDSGDVRECAAVLCAFKKTSGV